MTPRFQADADFNHKIVLALRRREPARDSEVLRITADSGRILVSHDRRTMPAHFVRFIQDRSGPGLIILEQGLDIGAAVEDLLLIWAVTDAEEWRDQIGFLPL